MIADLILTDADIRTMDPSRPMATAMAVGAGRIMAVGDDAAIRALAGPETWVIDARGRLVLPGFQDVHIHLLSGGTDLVETAYLYDAKSIDHLQAALKAHADGHAGLLSGVRIGRTRFLATQT